MANGAINLVVTEKALAELKQLNMELEKAATNIVNISKNAIGSKGSFKDVGGQKELNAELEKTKKRVDQLEKELKSYDTTAKKAASTTKKNTKEMDKFGSSMRKGAKDTATMTVRVKSFFKTLVLFDLARRAVDAFWGSLKKGFENLKALDSIRLQFKFIVADAQETAETMKFLTRISNAYGAELITLSSRYIKFRAATKQSNISAEASRKIFESVTKAAGVLGLKTHELQGVFLALEQMISKGKVTTEELRRQLGERLPGAMGIMADAIGVSIIELDKMLKKGEVLSATALPKFAVALEKAYGIENVKRVDTLVAATVRFENAFTSMVQAIEGGGGRVSKVLIFLYDNAAFLISQLGELALTQEEMFNKRVEFSIEKNLIKERKAIEENAEILKTTLKEEIDIRAKGVKDKLFELEIQKNFAEGQLRIFDRQKGTLTLNGQTEKQLKIKLRLVAEEIGHNQAILILQQKINDEANESEEIIQKRGKATLIETKLAKGLIQRLEEALKLYQKMLDTNQDITKRSGLQDQIKEIEGFIKILKDPAYAEALASEDLKEWTKGVEIEIDKLGFFYESLAKKQKKTAKDAAQAAKEFQDQVQEMAELVGKAIEGLADLGDAIVQRDIVRLEKKIDKIEEVYDKNKELIELEIGDEEAKQERLRQLDKKRAIDVAEIEKKIAKEKKKQFIINKVAALADIAINTAVWVTQVGSQTGLFGIALAPLVIALGAIQAAAVLAEPVPNFKDGHLIGTHKGIANTNDGNAQEFWQRGGQVKAIQGKNTLINMQKGDKIHKNIDSFIQGLPQDMVMDSLQRASIMTSIAGDRFLLDNLKTNQSFNDNFKDNLRKDIVKSLSGISIHNHSEAVGKAVKEALLDSNYKRNML